MQRTLIGLLLGAALAFPSSASAATLTITPPSDPVPEDAAFGLAVSGVADPGRITDFLAIKARGTTEPCAATPGDDRGELVAQEFIASSGPFAMTVTHTATDPGVLKICGWIDALAGELSAGPVETTVVVRPPNLSANALAAFAARPGETLSLTVDYAVEVPRWIKVVFAQTNRCAANSSAMHRQSVRSDDVVDMQVSGTGRVDASPTAFKPPGLYRFCTYLSEDQIGDTTTELVVESPPVSIAYPTVRCRSVGGRRGIADVRATQVACATAERVARRWGRHRTAPRSVGTFSCRPTGARRVRCASAAGQVRFRYRR